MLDAIKKKLQGEVKKNQQTQQNQRSNARDSIQSASLKPSKDTHDLEYKSKLLNLLTVMVEYNPKDFNMSPEEAKMFDVQQVYVFHL